MVLGVVSLFALYILVCLALRSYMKKRMGKQREEIKRTEEEEPDFLTEESSEALGYLGFVLQSEE